MRLRTLGKVLATGVLLVCSTPAKADSVPYQDVGQIAPTQTFTATSTGSVLGYFVQGGGASGGGAVDLDYVRLFDITQNMYGNWVFQRSDDHSGDEGYLRQCQHRRQPGVSVVERYARESDFFIGGVAER